MRLTCLVCERVYVSPTEWYCLCPECFDELHRCNGTTKAGGPCKNYHKNVSGYCAKHNKGHEHERTHAETYALIASRRDELTELENERMHCQFLAEQDYIAVDASDWLRQVVER